MDIEKLGMRVRQIWVAWAKEQPDAKPSWLVPWDELPERDKEVDRRIGVGLYGDFIAQHASEIARGQLLKPEVMT